MCIIWYKNIFNRLFISNSDNFLKRSQTRAWKAFCTASLTSEEDDDEDPEKDPNRLTWLNGGRRRDYEMDIEEDETNDMDIDADEEDEDDEIWIVKTGESCIQTTTDHPAYRITLGYTIPEPLLEPAWSDSELPDCLLYLPNHHTTISMVFSTTPDAFPPINNPPVYYISTTSYSYSVHWAIPSSMIRMRAEAAANSSSLTIPPPFIHSPTKPKCSTTHSPHQLLSIKYYRLIVLHRPPDRAPPQLLAIKPAGGLRADYGLVATMARELRRDHREICLDIGITESWDRLRYYTMLADGDQSQRQLLASRVNMLFRDRRAHAHTRLLMETEARMSREAWGRSMDASDLARAEVMSLRTTVHAQMTEITELQSADRSRRRAISDLLETDRGRREEMRELRAADRTRQQQIIQTLTVMQTLQREMIPLQGLVTTLQGQVTALQGQVMALQGQVTALQGQQGPAGGPAQPELPEEAGSSS
ncbi:hypothetical protein Tco_0915562 [Tanacetum coccineum]